MITRLSSSVPWGIKGHLTDVEVDIALGIPQLTIVGLPDQAVKESRDRVRSAIKNSGYSFPLKKVTVNLAPADLKKEGPLFDLPIALGILAAEGHVDPAVLKDYLAVGELGLDGKLRPVKGVIQAALAAHREEKIFLFPAENGREISLLSSGEKKSAFIPLGSLKDAVTYLKEGYLASLPETSWENFQTLRPTGPDLKEVKGQREAKRALEVAVSGGHNLILIGPPGGGKTMLARRIPSILPSLEPREVLEIAMIYGVSDENTAFFQKVWERPFRAPHHSLSTASLVGGGASPKPGEVSLAHRGVLFLDELSEFKKDAMESLRAPLEDKRILISRVSGSIDLPASFMLVAATNPCPCGYLTSRLRSCRCSLAQMENYRRRLSGPLVDRIDLHVEVPELKWEDLSSKQDEETSETVRGRIEEVRKVQRERYRSFPFLTNNEMNEAALKRFCALDSDSEAFLKRALKDLGLSARGHGRILKMARTLADMDASFDIRSPHIQEAVRYRVLDRQFIHA